MPVLRLPHPIAVPADAEGGNVVRLSSPLDDDWRRLSDDEAMPEAGAVLVGLARFKANRAEVEARRAPTGLALKSHERAHVIGDGAHLFELIEIEFPKFRDGRAFSSARLLRERYGFRGTLRASGNILPDQALFLARCGVDEIALGDLSRLAAFGQALCAYTVALQPTGTRLTQLRLRSRALAFAQAAE